MIPLNKRLEVSGRFPQVVLEIQPLLKGSQTIRFDKFTSYQFSSNMLVPVDAFSFSFVAPEDPNPFTSYIREGDIASLYADEEILATGIVDQIEVEVDGDSGEKATVNGRDLLGQLEDNAAVSINKEPLWGQSITLEAAAKKLIEGTRIQKVIASEAPTIAVLFASEPGESRLSSLLRLCEPLNCLLWTDPSGNLKVGKPDFASTAKGFLICSKSRRESNVSSMRATFSSASIPNKIVALWSDVQSTQIGIQANQIFDNSAEGPSRLRQNGHNVIKTVMTSYPSGGDAQSLSAAATFQAASAANATVLQALAKRELARANFNELLVHCVVPGHYNDNGEMYKVDTCYNVDFDRAGIQEKMYLYSIEYNLSEERGQYTVLSLCRLGTMVSDARLASSDYPRQAQSTRYV
jgi:prophage tail gpP-like protein